MRTMTMMLLMTLMMTLLTSVTAQPWPPKPTRSCLERRREKMKEVVRNNQQNMFQEFFCVEYGRLIESDIYDQLYITDQEATDACRSVNASKFVKAGRGGATAPHPRCCFAYLVCSGMMFNPTQENTLYVYGVLIKMTSAGTYYNPAIYAQDRWTVPSNCDADPCKTGNLMPTGRTCDGYVDCGRNSVGSVVHVEGTCPSGQGFSALEHRCAAGDCTTAPVNTTVLLGCRPRAVPVTGAIPGVPPEAYYERVDQLVSTGQKLITEQVCAAGLIFDPNDTNSTEKCLCKLPEQVACPNVSLIDVGVNAKYQWGQLTDLRKYNVSVEPQGSVYPGWLRVYRDAEFSYFDAQALAENELSGDWTLNFRFRLDPQGGNPSDFVVVENSHDVMACPNPSLRVSVVNTNSMTAEVTAGTLHRTGRVRLDNVLNRSGSGAVDVVVERRGNSLILKARQGNTAQFQQNSDEDSLGVGPLLATRCGLIFGRDFGGWIQNINLEKFGC